MVEFEPPKRKALSDSELQRALTKLGNTSDGLGQAEVLLSNQANAREEDSAALASWIAQMQQLGTPEAQRALSNMVLDVLPASVVRTEVFDEPEPTKEPVPVFTSEISIIRSRREIRARNEGLLTFSTYFAGLLLTGLSNALIAIWLELSFSEAIASAAMGLLVSGPIIMLLKTHQLHPLLRAAAVFGGRGVYFGSGLLLAALSVVLLAGSTASIKNQYLERFLDGYQTELIVVALLVAILSQLIARKFFFHTLSLAGLAILVFEISQNPSAFASTELTAITVDKFIWGSLAMGLVSATIYTFGQPHKVIKPRSLAWLLPVGYVLSVLSIAFAASETLPLFALSFFFLGVALSGRDLSSHGLGRLAGLAFLVSIAVNPFLEFVSGSAVAILSTLVILLAADQLFRRSSLHIPSLDTSYGFYGSFQLLTFLAMLISGVMGTESIQALVPLGNGMTNHELAFIAGGVVGLGFALLRIISIRKQDREIGNVQFRNMNLDNLLGL